MKRLVSGQTRSIVNLKRLVQVDHWLYPPVCLVCGLSGRPGLDLCAGCEADLEPLAQRCRRCGIELVRSVELCGRCTTRLPHFTAAWPGYAYRGHVERLVQRFKFQGDLAAGRVLATIYARRLAAMAAPRPDLMVPVPLHPRRRLRRGFNQAALLARDLGAELGGLPWMEVLRRRRSTAAQSDLPADRRRGNVRGAFALRHWPDGARYIALVDDVMTTGSTLDECARVLLRAGAARVDVWIVARA